VSFTLPNGEWRFLQAFPKLDRSCRWNAGGFFHFVLQLANAYDIVFF
jgi:hypothetical protein